MIDSSRTVIEKVVVHQVGSSIEGEGFACSGRLLQLQDDERLGMVLKGYFINGFKTGGYHQFIGAAEGAPGLVCKLAAGIFENPSSFYNASLQLAPFLYQAGNKPKVKGGDLYMVLFSGCGIDGEIVDALGIYKSESKEKFLEIQKSGDEIDVAAREGINTRKLDKGCIIFNTSASTGYKVLVVDNVNGGSPAGYWTEDFLALQPREDNYYHTSNYIDLCTGFVKDVYNNDNNVDKSEQLDFMNRSLEFFEKRGTFKQEDFEKEVTIYPQVAQAFTEYRQIFQEDLGVSVTDRFDISKEALKRGKKYFKSILKLDKNFHVYVHGKGEFIEKGFDPVKKMKFYKLFFDQEQ